MTTSDRWDALEPRQCPVCGAGPAGSKIFLKQSIDMSRISGFSYASRKTPEYMRFELVSCRHCATVFASSAPPKGAISRAYHEAEYDSADEARLAAETYRTALTPFLAALPARKRALEIGTGTGVFLTQLQQAGFAEVIGIEPSRAAIDAAEPTIRSHIREGIFVGDDFPAETFDLICCFQTLEHVPDPLALVTASARLLRRGGLLALITHDYRSVVNRLLGRRSPIIDIEHLQLFCRPSLDRLLVGGGLETVAIQSFANRYRLAYWLRLAPFPSLIKPSVQKLAARSGAGDIKLRVNVGNLLSIGVKRS